ncbi:MAG TPA: hypothetical protein VHV31_14695 [Nitrolancea sp.]|nr:hypothetical protein [Nitrolancea sp.]
MWIKLGRIFEPGGFSWMHTHAQNPLPESLGGGVYRVHFATRDSQNRARGGWFTFSPDEPSHILEVSDVPTLDLGPLGAFDDSGVMPNAVVARRGERWLYYTGWSKAVEVPFSFHIGLATSPREGVPFVRESLAPVLGRSRFDPFIVGAPGILVEEDRMRMWYISATRWIRESEGAKPKHYYTVKHADSVDGINWNCSDHLCIPYGEDEYAIARPVVWRTEDGYHMWFTFRGGKNTYRVGTADSKDGINWSRHPEPLDIDVSADGWDSKMICYAHPLFHDGKTYALYNGNDYGATGIGLALLT